MEFLLSTTTVEEYTGECVVIFSTSKQKHSKDLQQLLDLNNFSGALNDIVTLNFVTGFAAKKVVVVGLGDSPVAIKNYKQALISLTKFLNSAKITNAMLTQVNVDKFSQSWLFGFSARVIKNSTYKIKKIAGAQNKELNFIESIAFFSNDKDYCEITKGVAIADGMALARHLGDLPGNICTPSYLANIAQDLAKEHSLECEILDKIAMQDLGMNALLSVSQGSIEEPKFITLSYKGAGDAKPIVLVGKGVTFDTGGISLKPGANMDEMKYDMCGAGAVLGAIKAIAQMKLDVNVTIVVPTVENMPAHNASKPGDVVKSMSGQTIEILNTDAEGRLILCDALTYCKKFNPEVVIDVATLTGAVIVALGKHNTGVMANNQKLADDIISAAKDSLDYAWQLPIADEYDEQLKSNFADMANIGGREAGSITAACFLARYTKDYTWAHLDIAGTAWLSGKNKGATGRPVALLSQYIINKTNSN